MGRLLSLKRPLMQTSRPRVKKKQPLGMCRCMMSMGTLWAEPVYDDDGNIVDYIQEGLYDDEEGLPDEGDLPEEYADLEGGRCCPCLVMCHQMHETCSGHAGAPVGPLIMQWRTCLTYMSA